MILTGFMGVGKSTVGPKVADELTVKYYDTDKWMEMESGINVPELVRTDMAEFRRLEAKALLQILDLEPGVISTGGGIVSTQVGREVLLGTTATVVWMRAPFDDLVNRVHDDTSSVRPLFEDKEKARGLYHERMDWYQETSDFSVNALQPIELVVEDIVNIARAI
jgi:shikimate kinase